MAINENSMNNEIEIMYLLVPKHRNHKQLLVAPRVIYQRYIQAMVARIYADIERTMVQYILQWMID